MSPLGAYLSWFVALAFFAGQFVVRLTPGLVLPQILEKFQVSAGDYGILSAMYYYGYALGQIPVAIGLNRLGPRRMIGGGALLCGVSLCCFTLTTSWGLALLSRFCIGLASAVGFLGTSRVITLCFPKERYSRLVGYSFTVGLSGAVYGGKPVALLMEIWGWQSVLYVLAGGCLSLGFLAWFLLPNLRAGAADQGSMRESFAAILGSRGMLVLGLANLLMVGPLEGFADVWGVSFLAALRHTERGVAAGMTSLIFVGMLCGGPILAWLADRSRRPLAITVGCGLGMAALFVGILGMGEGLSEGILRLLMLVVGILCCYQVLIFSIGAELVEAAHLDLAVAFLNCVNMLGGSFFHSIIGLVLDRVGGPPGLDGGISVSAYIKALSVIPAASALGAILLFLAASGSILRPRVGS